MIEIELSLIPDAEVDLRTISSLLVNFERNRGVKVRVRTMQWNEAWIELLTIASRGSGPDVSHIGGTWVSSLAITNTLRSFRMVEIQEMGGARAFLPATWQSASMVGDEHIWAIPWTGYAYVICYRKDWLQQIGITDFQEAFRDRHAVVATVQKMCNARLPGPWLIGQYPPPYTDLVHIAASWIWAAGGDFVSPDGKEILISQDAALAGLADWVELYRRVPKAQAQLSPAEAAMKFARGNATAVVTNIRTADEIILSQGDAEVRENLGLANLTEIPWCSGGSFIVWKHTQEDRERERAAVDLVKYLTSRDVEIQWARSTHCLAARMEAIEQLYPEKHPFSKVAFQLAQQGRAYPNIPLWRRLEYQIGQTLFVVLEEARRSPKEDALTILRKHLSPLAERLNQTR